MYHQAVHALRWASEGLGLLRDECNNNKHKTIMTASALIIVGGGAYYYHHTRKLSKLDAASGNWCDLVDMHEQERKKTLTSTYTPNINVSPEDDGFKEIVQQIFLGNIAQSKSLTSNHFNKILELSSVLIFYQDNARKITSSAFLRLDSPLCTTSNLARGDVNHQEPNCLPIATSKNAHIVVDFEMHLKKFLVKLGMLDRHWSIVRYHAFNWLYGSAMGFHGDYFGKEDDDLFFLRLVLSVGDERLIEFRAQHVVKGHKKAREKGKFNVYTLTTKRGADAYLTSPWANGKFVLCWYDEERENGIQIKHQVKGAEEDKADAKERHNVGTIVDFPLTSIELVKAALKYVGGKNIDIWE